MIKKERRGWEYKKKLREAKTVLNAKTRKVTKTSRAHPLNQQPQPESDKWCEREPQEAYHWAKEYFLKGMSVSQISERTGFTPQKINDVASGEAWGREEKKIQKAITHKVYESKKHQLSVLVTETLSLVEMGIEDVKAGRDENPLTVKDLKAITDTATQLNAMLNLAEGKPTAIIESVRKSKDEIMEMLSVVDPFIDYKNEIEQ